MGYIVLFAIPRGQMVMPKRVGEPHEICMATWRHDRDQIKSLLLIQIKRRTEKLLLGVPVRLEFCGCPGTADFQWTLPAFVPALVSNTPPTSVLLKQEGRLRFLSRSSNPTLTLQRFPWHCLGTGRWNGGVCTTLYRERFPAELTGLVGKSAKT